MTRELAYCRAINEALDQSLEKDPAVYVVGLGVPDVKGVFDTTSGLLNKYGPSRVMDMPAAENGMTGIVIGSALVGMRPVMVHQRMDFAILAFDQLVNQAAKWHYMFGGKQACPIVVRMIVGRGWGQGSQHSQSLQSWLAHVPGLKVIMPSIPQDAKGMLIAAIEDNNPVMMIEHRWLFNIQGPVDPGYFTVPIGKARVIRPGKDVSIVALSYMVIESLRAAEILASQGIDAEVVDLRSLRPLDTDTILCSLEKTGRLVVADTGWKSFGASAEIIAVASEKGFSSLKAAPERVASPDISSPATPSLAKHFFPGKDDIVDAARRTLGLAILPRPDQLPGALPADVPDNNFKGPF